MTNHRLLHILWTKAVGTKDYDKQQWRDLEKRMIKLTNYESKENQEEVLSAREDQTSEKNISNSSDS